MQDVMMAPVYALVIVLRKGERESDRERERETGYRSHFFQKG